jgi:hypothetical protein
VEKGQILSGQTVDILLIWGKVKIGNNIIFQLILKKSGSV